MTCWLTVRISARTLHVPAEAPPPMHATFVSVHAALLILSGVPLR
jgi:hypothetical protein